MKTKIDYTQLEKLITELGKREIPSKVVLELLNIDTLAKLTVVQYNYILLLLTS